MDSEQRLCSSCGMPAHDYDLSGCVNVLLAEVKRLHHQLFLSANVINAIRVLVEAGYDRRLNDYKAAFGKVERALLVYDDLTKNVGEPDA